MERKDILNNQLTNEPEKTRSGESTEKVRPNKLEAEAQAFWSSERKEGEPQIKFKIAYGMHVGSKDLEFLKKDFDVCDVYAPENFGWQPYDLEMEEKLSYGIVSPEVLKKAFKNRPYYYGHMMANAEMVYRSRKPILLIDVPYSHKLNMDRIHLPSISDFINLKNLEDKIKLAREFITKTTAFDKEREEYIFTQIPIRMKELFLRKPELHKKQELKVLISLGSSHTPLFHMMHKANPNMVERSFQELPYKFSLDTATQRTIAFGISRPEDLNDELLARLVMGYEFSKYFVKSMTRAGEKDISAKFSEKVDRYINMFSLEEIREFYEQLKTRVVFRDLFLEFLRKKGIKDKSL